MTVNIITQYAKQTKWHKKHNMPNKQNGMRFAMFYCDAKCSVQNKLLNDNGIRMWAIPCSAFTMQWKANILICCVRCPYYVVCRHCFKTGKMLCFHIQHMNKFSSGVFYIYFSIFQFSPSKNSYNIKEI